MEGPTKLEEVRDQLARRDEQLAEAQALSHIGSWDWEIASDTSTASDELYRILGIEPQPALRLADYLDRVHPDDRAAAQAAIDRAIATGDPFERVLRIVRPDGGLRVVQARGRLTLDADGRPRSVIGTCRDITDEQRLLEQMHRMQRLDAVGRLAGGIAHDFNNLLTVILSYTELLARRADDPARVREGLAEIRTAAESAAAMSRQLLTFARGDVAATSVVDLSHALEGNERLLRRLIGEGIELSLELSPDLGRVRCSPSQLEQVLVNLVVNARDAMPDGGHLTIRGGNRTVGADTELDLAPGPYVVLEVEDDGGGMPPEVAARAFEPFFTTKPVGQGTGLGLSTTYGIVKQTGGDVTLASTPGQGTRVSIWLPRTVEETEAIPEKTLSQEGAEGARVLVVEDTPQLRVLIDRVLSDAGYKVRTAAGPDVALELLGDSASPPAVLLTDIVLPGLSGVELAAMARERLPQISVIYMSGYPRGGGTTPRVDLGDDSQFLKKPFTPDELLAAIQYAVETIPSQP